MKKFIDALKKEQIEESTANIMIGPMKKVFTTNPSIIVGVNGLRYIANGGSFCMSPIFYIVNRAGPFPGRFLGVVESGLKVPERVRLSQMSEFRE